MSLNELPFLLSEAYSRAVNDVNGEDRILLRRCFRRARAALEHGDPKPAVLILYRWP